MHINDSNCKDTVNLMNCSADLDCSSLHGVFLWKRLSNGAKSRYYDGCCWYITQGKIMKIRTNNKLDCFTLIRCIRTVHLKRGCFSMMGEKSTLNPLTLNVLFFTLDEIEIFPIWCEIYWISRSKKDSTFIQQMKPFLKKNTLLFTTLLYLNGKYLKIFNNK